MKKFIFLVGFFLFYCFASAQNFGGGVIAGATFSQIDGDTYGGYTKLGIVGGVMVNRKLADKFVMAMELRFIQKGSRASYNINKQSGEYYKARLNYIQIPLVGQYNFWNNFWGELGLSYGYLISFKEENDYGELPYPVPFKKSEFAGLAGVAYDIPKTKLRLHARFAYAILPVRQNKSQQQSNAYYFDMRSRGQYNNNLELALTWFLNKG